MAYFLTMVTTSLIKVEGFTLGELILDFFLQMLIGGAGGCLMGRGITLTQIGSFAGDYPAICG